MLLAIAPLTRCAAGRGHGRVGGARRCVGPSGRSRPGVESNKAGRGRPARLLQAPLQGDAVCFIGTAALPTRPPAHVCTPRAGVLTLLAASPRRGWSCFRVSHGGRRAARRASRRGTGVQDGRAARNRTCAPCGPGCVCLAARAWRRAPRAADLRRWSARLHTHSARPLLNTRPTAPPGARRQLLLVCIQAGSRVRAHGALWGVRFHGGVAGARAVTHSRCNPARCGPCGSLTMAPAQSSAAWVICTPPAHVSVLKRGSVMSLGSRTWRIREADLARPTARGDRARCATRGTQDRKSAGLSDA